MMLNVECVCLFRLDWNDVFLRQPSALPTKRRLQEFMFEGPAELEINQKSQPNTHEHGLRVYLGASCGFGPRAMQTGTLA